MFSMRSIHHPASLVLYKPTRRFNQECFNCAEHPSDDGDADLGSHDTFHSGAPHNTFARMRKDDPISWTDWEHGKGFWSITRHQDIKAMTRNVEVFSSAQGIRMEDQSHEEYLARRTFQETDPPEHSHTRVRLAKAFSRGTVAKFEETIRDICNDILDQTLDSKEFDATKKLPANCRCEC